MSKALVIWNSGLSFLLVILYGWMLAVHGDKPIIERRITSLEQQTDKIIFGMQLPKDTAAIVINNYITK